MKYVIIVQGLASSQPPEPGVDDPAQACVYILQYYIILYSIIYIYIHIIVQIYGII